jgi:hypothetical protein
LLEAGSVGHKSGSSPPDRCPGDGIAGAIADIVDTLISTLEDTHFEPDLGDDAQAQKQVQREIPLTESAVLGFRYRQPTGALHGADNTVML